MSDELWFEQLAAAHEADEVLAPSCLKSRLYSRLIVEQEKTGPLLSLKETQGLCVYEKLIEILPVEQAMVQSFQYCKVCHSRVAGENIENAPIYWANCPYCEFQNR
mgnify:CR=1 FL=1